MNGNRGDVIIFSSNIQNYKSYVALIYKQSPK